MWNPCWEKRARGRGIFNRSNALLSALYSRHTFITRVSLLFRSFYRFFAHKHALLQMRKWKISFHIHTTKLWSKKISRTHSTSLSYRCDLNMREALLIWGRGTDMNLLKNLWNTLFWHLQCILIFQELHAHEWKSTGKYNC